MTDNAENTVQVINQVSSIPKIAKFLVHGAFDAEMSNEFAEFYYDCKRSGVTHVILDIDSHGGYVHVLDSMLSYIEQNDMEWIGVARGACMSCACLLLAACDLRFASKRAEIMFHDLSSGGDGRIDEVLEDAMRTKRYAMRTMTSFAKRTNKTAKWWLDKANSFKSRDFYISANQAKKLGLVDEIGTPLVTIKCAHVIDVEVL